MMITETTARKVVIQGIPNQDPIAVYLEDQGPGAGKITITCFDDCWTNYWGSMGGDQTISQFFQHASDSYIAGKLHHETKPTVVDIEAIEAHVKMSILKERRQGDLTEKAARELWENVDSIEFDMPIEVNAGFFHDVYGDEWWYRLPHKPNSKYEYLVRIIQTIKAALAQLDEKATA